eukprot:3988854-Pyramimonas_sp.AAC.1
MQLALRPECERKYVWHNPQCSTTLVMVYGIGQQPWTMPPLRTAGSSLSRPWNTLARNCAHRRPP